MMKLFTGPTRTVFTHPSKKRFKSGSPPNSPGAPSVPKPMTQRGMSAMDEALARVELNAHTSADAIVLAMAQEMRQVIEGRRRGAQKQRKQSEAVRQRIRATLRAFSELSSKLQKHPLGRRTVERLLEAVKEKNHRTDEATLAKDLAKVRPLIRLIQSGKTSPSLIRSILEGRIPSSSGSAPSETILEQKAGRQAVARAEARAEVRLALIGMIRRRFLGS